MSTELPQIFGRYVLTHLIGEGGMAEVYNATVRVAEGLTKRVVIKKIRREYANQHEFTRMFVDEAKIALSLNHANIVQVFDFGQVRGVFYLAMELVEGIDVMRLFHSVRAAGDSFPPVIAAYVGHQVAAGLAYAHRKRDDYGNPLGIVHRDVSPHNVMVSFEGQVKILDFGIARTKQRALARIDDPADVAEPLPAEWDTETIKGKVAYMSPEQAFGRPVDQRSDVYSLGVVLQELLSGRLLFRHKDRMKALEMVRTQQIPKLQEVAPDLPEALAAIVNRALAREPEARFENARAMQADLAAYLHRADPVVDDEVLSGFVVQYHEPAGRGATGSGTSEQATRELGDSQGTNFPLRRAHESQRVIVVHVALEPRETFPGHVTNDPSPYLRLASDLAFKREAVVLRMDSGAIALVVGAILTTGEDGERALRLAMALREEIGEVAPGVAVGIAVAATAAVVQHADGGPIEVRLPLGVGEQIERVAKRFMEGPVSVSLDLVERLSRTWRFGENIFVEADPAEADPRAPVDPALERAVPVLGPAREVERRVHQAPGSRLILYGRELELKTLRDAFSESIRTRESRALVVLGAPGLGRRALVERFVSSLPRTACWILRAAGSWSRRNVPLGAFVELLSRFLGVNPTTTCKDIETRLGEYEVHEADKLAEALAASLGLPCPTDPGPNPLERHDGLRRLMRRLLRGLGQRRPILMIIENLHFLDQQSLSLLREWARTRHPLPILGLCTGRPGARTAELNAEPNVGLIELHELDEQARRDLIVRRFEDPGEAGELADAILARTGGNPLFIEETLAALLQANVIGWNAAGRYLTVRRRGASIEVPPSIEAALLGRLDELSPADREVVQGAAVLGRVFVPSELSEILDRNVARSIETLIDHNVFEREPSPVLGRDALRFTTVSLHDVCKQNLADRTRERLHAAAAEIKLGRGDYAQGRDDGPVADHLITAGHDDQSVEPALRAAAYAYEVAGNVEAFYYLTQALKAMADGDERRFDALRRRESILRVWGRHRARGADIRQLIRAAEQHGDREQEVIASLRLLRFYVDVGYHQRADRLVPRLEQRVSSLADPSAWRPFLAQLTCDLAFARGDFEDAEQVAQQTLADCAEDERGVRRRCRLHSAIGRVRLATGRFDEADVSFQQALELARSIHNRRLEADALNHLGSVAGRASRYQEAVDYFKSSLAIDRDLGDRFATGTKLANLGLTYSAIGLFRRAERYLRKALELHQATGQSAQFAEVIAHLADVVAATGDTGGARELYNQAASMAERGGDVRTAMRARIRLAQALLDDGDDDAARIAARQIAEAVLVTARTHGLRTASCRALHVLSEVAAREGDLDSAIAHERDAVTLVRAGAAPIDGVVPIHTLGKLLMAQGERSEGEALLQEAADVVQCRADQLRDAELRSGYLEQPTVRQILRAGESSPR